MRKEIIETYNGVDYAGEIIVELDKIKGSEINPKTYHTVEGFVDGISTYSKQVTDENELFDSIPVVERAVRQALKEKIERLGKTSTKEKLVTLGFNDYIALDEQQTEIEGDS